MIRCLIVPLKTALLFFFSSHMVTIIIIYTDSPTRKPEELPCFVLPQIRIRVVLTWFKWLFCLQNGLPTICWAEIILGITFFFLLFNPRVSRNKKWVLFLNNTRSQLDTRLFGYVYRACIEKETRYEVDPEASLSLCFLSGFLTLLSFRECTLGWREKKKSSEY